MRRISTAQRSIDCLLTSAGPSRRSAAPCYACLSRGTAAAASFSTAATAQAAPSVTDTLKVWTGKGGKEKGPKQKGPRRVTIDGRTYSAEEAEQYVKANTWNGLVRVSELVEQMKNEKNPRTVFSFLKQVTGMKATHIRGAVRAALAEVLLLKTFGLPLSATTKASDKLPKPTELVHVRISQPDGEAAKVEFKDDEQREQLHKALEEHVRMKKDEKSPPAMKKGELYRPDLPLPEDWENVALEDLNLRFAVVKRAMQLTGKKLSDPAIQECTTAGKIAEKLIVPPPARKLAQEVLSKKELTNLPNVQFSGRRVTVVDKETAVGRWKVIEQELEARGITV